MPYGLIINLGGEVVGKAIIKDDYNLLEMKWIRL